MSIRTARPWHPVNLLSASWTQTLLLSMGKDRHFFWKLEEDIWRSGKSHFCYIRISMLQRYPPTLEINSKSSVADFQALCLIPIPQGGLGITVCLLLVSEMKHKCWDLDYWLIWLVIPIIVTLFTNMYGDVSILWQLVWLDSSLIRGLYKFGGYGKLFKAYWKWAVFSEMMTRSSMNSLL